MHKRGAGRVCPFIRPPIWRAELIFPALILGVASETKHQCLCHAVPKNSCGRVRSSRDRHGRMAQFALELSSARPRSPLGRVVDHQPRMTCP